MFSHTQNSLVLQYIGHRKPINFLISLPDHPPHHLKLSAEDHTSQLDGVLDQVRDLADKLKTILDTLEGWRSRLKDHEPPHVLPKDVETQLQQLAVSRHNMLCWSNFHHQNIFVSAMNDKNNY